MGDSVALRETSAVRGDGCAHFYAIEPRGYVCLDEATTLDPRDPQYTAIRQVMPQREGPWPFEYGESRQTPRYWSLPSEAEQRRREWSLGDHLAMVSKLRTASLEGEQIPRLLRGVDVTPANQAPGEVVAHLPTVHDDRLEVVAGSTISWTGQFDANGRTWLLTPDFALIPKDKVAPFPHHEFRGVDLRRSARLPIAYVRGKPRPKYGRSEDGQIQLSGQQWPRLSWMQLTGPRWNVAGKSYWETSDSAALVEERDATILIGARWTPWGDAVQRQADGLADAGWLKLHEAPRIVSRPRPPASSRATWIEVSVHGGWMIAYEGSTPVYATLVASGRGKTRRMGAEEFVESATPTGVYNILGKYRASTMAVTEIVHYDVTFAQPFWGAYALHTAYWHDRWGEKASMGCVNLSPHDALWLFQWTEPEMAPGWYGMNSNELTGYATTVVVHE